jgi:hypothetical protein
MKRFVPAFAIVFTVGFAAYAAPDGDADVSTTTGESQEPLTKGVADPKAAGNPASDRGDLFARDGGITRPPVVKACKRPFTTPVYAQPADDSIAFGSLLEGAGYGAETNSDWTDIASGNFCGGAEKELVLLKNRHSNFSIMRGPTPYAVGAFDNESNAAHQWRTVAAGDLDGDSFDEIVAVRRVTAARVPDVFVMKVDPSACDVAKVTQSATVGAVGNSEWLERCSRQFRRHR